MQAPDTFDDFLLAFFNLFTSKNFRGEDFLTYLQRPRGQRGGDEASIVDTVIVGPLLGLLGFETGEQVYNRQQHGDRPDFAPTDSLYGTCFVVEDKNTWEDLSLDQKDPDSHFAQLTRYVRALALRLGMLTNGRRLLVWRFDDPEHPTMQIDLDIPVAIQEWTQHMPPSLSPTTTQQLHTLFELCRKATFSNLGQLEREIAISLDEWQRQALPLGTDSGNEAILVDELQSLVLDLQHDARRILQEHLTRYDDYHDRANRLTDTAPDLAKQEFDTLRRKVMAALDTDANKVLLGLDTQDLMDFETVLLRLEQDARAFFSPQAVLTDLLAITNNALQRKYANRPRAARPWRDLEQIPALHAAVRNYIEQAFAWHQRQATLRHTYQAALKVNDDYTVWRSLVQETMLGDMHEDQRRDEFALQAAYVVFIRLLLIRVCEDKGIFPHRLIADGGLLRWQDVIEHYLVFTNGNPYTHLIEIAYENAQNIYAHFFTGRELFNWYTLDQRRFIMALHRLSRFDFAEVDSDIVGTIYNTYVDRKEKREKGQYYTPPAIVNYILDDVGYRDRQAIIGPNKRLIDPACGSGTFLVTAARRLVAAYQGQAAQITDPLAVLERVQNSLYGFDLNPFACYLAEVNLLIQVLDLVKLAHQMGQRPRLQRFHIYNVDALTRPTGMHYYVYFNTLLAEENDQVDQIKARRTGTPYVNGFAFVVANPPYGAKLSDAYKEMLRGDWANVFYGQPDSYTFFLQLGLELLAPDGRLGFITPNTYLMGTNTAALRNQLLTSGRIEQIVDLPQGIWPDANVDCVLLFLAHETDAEKRKAQQVQINILGLRDTLDKLTARDWSETLTQKQERWLADPRSEMNIRYDELLQRIEDACRIPANGGTKVLRLGDVTVINRGIEPYHSRKQGQSGIFIKPKRQLTASEQHWKPLLDSSSFIGRYELQWGKTRPYLNYGKWLYRAYDPKFYESPKLLFIRLRNRALKRRLVATFDDQKFYNRHNFSNIIAGNPHYNLKYILALFNSSLLNFWYARQYPDVEVSLTDTRQLPIYPANADTQAELVALVDAILAQHAELNKLREQGYSIRRRRDGSTQIEVPYDHLLAELQQNHPDFAPYTFFDAEATGSLRLPDECDRQATIGSNVFIPDRFPNTVVLRHNRLWLEVPDDDIRRYLLGYLSRPRWQGKTWNDLKNQALVPVSRADLDRFFTSVATRTAYIQTLLDAVANLDATIDERVLDLYSITDAADRERILGSAPALEDADAEPDAAAEPE